MNPRSVSIQPDLFEQDGARGVPVPQRKEQLATLIEALLLEIAAAMTTREIRNDQDHG
jgi:hypothetical protein